MNLPYRPAAGPVEAELVGGPEDGTRLAVPYPRPYMDMPQPPGVPAVRYHLDPGCLAAPVVRYLYQPTPPAMA